MAGKDEVDWHRAARTAYWERLGLTRQSEIALAKAMARIGIETARCEQIKRKRAGHPLIRAALFGEGKNG